MKVTGSVVCIFAVRSIEADRPEDTLHRDYHYIYASIIV